MIKLDNGVLVLDHQQNSDDILPLSYPGVKGRGAGWFIDIGIEAQDVLYLLLDAEILEDDIPIRYIARNGEASTGTARIEELVSGPDGNACRLRGIGAPLPAFLADEPRVI